MPITLKALRVEEERTHFPTMTEFRVEKNPCYVCSLITGVVSPLFHFPFALWSMAIWPFIKAVCGCVFFVPLSMFAGITGRAAGYRVSDIHESNLTTEQKEKALAELLKGTGYIAVPVDREFKGGSGEH